MKNRCSTIFKITLLTLFSIFFTENGFTQAEEDPQYIYVCNQGSASVTVLNAATNEIFETVDLQELGFSANAKPHHTIADADGSHWYVTLIGENRVLKFNRNNELVDEATLEVPGLMTMHPSSERLYVGRSMSAVNPPQSFGGIDRANMELLDEVGLFFTRPHAISTSPDGRWIFVGSLSENQILTMNMETEESNLTNIPGSTHTFVNFAISPDGETMVATGQVSGKLLFFDITDPLSPQMTGSISVGAQPWHPVFSPDGKKVYFANKQDHTVAVIDMESRSVEAVIEGEGLAQPHGEALPNDGKFLYVTSNNLDGMYNPEGAEETQGLPGTVTIINTETHTIEKVIEVGKYASGIGTNAR